MPILPQTSRITYAKMNKIFPMLFRLRVNFLRMTFNSITINANLLQITLLFPIFIIQITTCNKHSKASILQMELFMMHTSLINGCRFTVIPHKLWWSFHKINCHHDII